MGKCKVCGDEIVRLKKCGPLPLVCSKDYCKKRHRSDIQLAYYYRRTKGEEREYRYSYDSAGHLVRNVIVHAVADTGEQAS